ncbi:enoyl-CoA hydratase/isomerase family protein [Pseudomonas sp. B392_1p]|uniref:enoyl-CoA hydratase/isomerase family protein n=1 Tax=Pseudomonas sp. B392_1p TaxID=3457507 RepID=UPI003FD249FE
MAENLVRRERRGAVAVLTLEGPPVNAFSLAMRRELHDALQWAREDSEVGALVLTGSGRGFSAGGDIREFGTDAAAASPGLSSDVHVAIERMGKPVIAAVHGFALGGGLETVLACHYRIAESDASLALPEVNLATLPLSATQRLPRLLGVLPALYFMVEGRRHPAAEFRNTMLFDQVVEPGQGLATACALAADLAAVPLAPDELEQRLVRHLPVPGADPEKELLDAGLWLLLRQPDCVAQALLKALEAAVRSEHFDAGLDCARRLYDQLMAGEDIRRARDRFLSTRPGRSPRADHNEP